MSFDVDDFLDSYERPTRQVPVCPRAGLLAEHAQVEAEILAARQEGLTGPSASLLARLDELEAEIDASVKVFTLEARTFSEWADLQRAHPPTKAQASKGASVDPETFEVAAFAACASDPPVTKTQAQRMRDTLPPSEWRALIDAVVGLHQERVTSPKSWRRSVIALMNGDFSPTWGNEGSLAVPSLDGNAGQ